MDRIDVAKAYWCTGESILKVFSQDYPYSIFKYCDFTVDSITNQVNSLENLKNHVVWLSDPLSFNDPFDCSVAFDGNLIVNEMAIKDLSFIVNTLNTFSEEEISNETKKEILSSSKPVDELINVISNLLGQQALGALKNMLDDLHYSGVNDFNQRYKSKLKVSCFSDSNKSLLMWGHYSNKHQGFCIEYDLGTIDDKENFKKYLFPVKYTHKLIDLTQYYIDNVINKKNIDKQRLIESVLYKSKDWAYEKEWRIVVNQAEYVENQINTPKPKAIYIGAKVNFDNKNLLIDISKKLAIPIFEMQIDSYEYKLNIGLRSE